MTQVGASGFSFIDKIAPSAQSVDQLEWIVAHNISHELMLAFGVPENYDQTGTYIDSKVANWSMMVSPTSTFSPAAAAAITQALATQNTDEFGQSTGRPGDRHGSRADDHRPLGPGGRGRPRHAAGPRSQEPGLTDRLRRCGSRPTPALATNRCINSCRS